MKPTAAFVGMMALASLAFILVSFGHNQDPVEKPLPYSHAPDENQKPTYRLIPHPLYNPQKLVEEFQPLVDYLNRALPETPIRIEASRDYQAFEKKIRAREADILMPNPWQAIEAMKVGYHVVAMWGDADDFRGIFILRKDSKVKKPSDLKGKAISYPSPTALAAAIMPQYFLFTQGIDIKKDIQNVYVGSQESSIMNVFLGATAAGATWPPPWRQFQKDHPAQAEQLTVAWETPSLINNAVMVRDNLPPDFGQRLQQALLDLPKTAEGQKILKDIETARFHAANDKSYAIVREYVERFEKEVRKVEIP
ncbi:MAG TPA: phosphate/phosphite/phosphonate ABC transporter substrate-binding protein [Rhodospirillaceae bacterium]|nr:phosphate/phosphite/phosphonate ABC transporter substrate-binding protein [Rhodospirillaceae bacterium]